jgi:hypothetical protein
MGNGKQLVVIHKNEPRISSFLIAQGFDRRHEYIVRLIKRYQKRFERIKPLVVVKKIKGRGRPVEEYLLSEAQFIFLGTVFKNSEIVLDFKEKLAIDFCRVKNLLAKVHHQHVDQNWIASRDFGKKQRLALTDVIKEFVEYAKEQGSNNADWYYTAFSKMTWGLLFILDGNYKSARDVLSDQQLTTMASAERVITKGLRDCMKAKMFYKDIYKQIKKNVLTFADLTGQTKVIEDQLKLTE